ncbi:MAG: BREX-2 system adenine-specific DNA-methyltransferase PglX [Corynebacterium sp.]|uniref:BREX-2 system adenine-specific DNA-methyltransferase PglX n=1 Tax=Corynebacterium sp. TaxID=1720 RepID=UPI0026DF585C|nr:BREX-2 system adenine-specific DNA-methyltransferase PglX [Corynebacterium sp.]MDO5670382.1 BREX-2 system adenine-specific DNA-methyltransferase PglX [Corynebacterium sp.]
MTNPAFSAALTKALGTEVTALVDDMRVRLHADPTRLEQWKADFEKAKKAERVAGAFSDWEDEQLHQAAVGWALTTVFLRFVEDNSLFGDGEAFVSGHTPQLRQAARDREEQFYATHPEQNYRGYLQHCFTQLADVPATQALVDDYAAFRLMEPTDDAARRLIDFWRDVDQNGNLVWSLHDSTLSTRFLGDMYQDLSEFARKRYALLQTPEFVEEFILSRTLTPALEERPLEGFKLIDPTCGSGHFLLGAFHMLLDAWHAHAPGEDPRALAESAMSAIHGVDINPFAVAITRFRLTVAYMQAAKHDRLSRQLPEPGFTVLAGDSLLYGPASSEDATLAIGSTESTAYTTKMEDHQALSDILNPQAFDVVVGNPPYITVKDKALNRRYRERYAPYCRGKYAMTAPFMVLFFKLARGNEVTQRPGWVGQITSNSFMQRNFGRVIVEQFFADIDLREVIDSSGAYIPGHGTPTVILIGRHDKPSRKGVLGVLGVQGEPGVPKSPREGLVWHSIVNNIDNRGFENEYISVSSLTSEFLSEFPLSLSGGAAPQVAETIDSRMQSVLATHVYRVGVFAILGSDEAMFFPQKSTTWRNFAQHMKLIQLGNEVRDFRATTQLACWFPYDKSRQLLTLEQLGDRVNQLWPTRRVLQDRATFSGGTYLSDGRPWYEWHQFPIDQGASELTITFAFVATHNHFVLDRGGKVFKQSAPVIKLPADATEDDHLELLGILNSSTACFWLKQNSHDKGNGGYGGGIASDTWERFYEFTGTTLKRFPLPEGSVLERGRRLDTLAQQLTDYDPAVLFDTTTPSAAVIDHAQEEYYRIRELMIAEQEELDWAVYHLYGLTDTDLSLPVGNVTGIPLGTRAFEIALARRVAAGDTDTAWFDRHHSTLTTTLPTCWDDTYRGVVEKRLALISEDRSISLLERPEYKRRWADEPWDTKVHHALEAWLLVRLETPSLWFRHDGMPQTRTLRELAGIIETDPGFADVRDVLPLWSTKHGRSILDMLMDLLNNEPVPYLKALRYKGRGIRKRAEWEATWDAQRGEDAGEIGPEDVPVPPNYTSADMYPAVWRHRGKLDVPKERFISYPGASPVTDPTFRIGWAGWDHLQQGLALMSLYSDLKDDDAPRETLGAILSGLKEQLPWIVQWHNDIDPNLGVRLGDYLTNQLRSAAADIGTTVEDLDGFVPETRRRRTTKKKGQA